MVHLLAIIRAGYVRVNEDVNEALSNVMNGIYMYNSVKASNQRQFQVQKKKRKE